MLTRSFLFLAAVVLLAPGGCGPAKLDEKKTWSVPRGDSQLMHLPKQPKPQRVTVEYESDEPVDVAIYNTADVKEGENLPASKARGIDRSKTTGSVSADLEPEAATTVTVTALSKTANVKIHVHNKK